MVWNSTIFEIAQSTDTYIDKRLHSEIYFIIRLDLLRSNNCYLLIYTTHKLRFFKLTQISYI